MKRFLLLYLLGGLTFMVGGIWAAIKFLIYLFKDEPFGTMLPVWMLIGGFAFCLLLILVKFFKSRNE